MYTTQTLTEGKQREGVTVFRSGEVVHCSIQCVRYSSAIRIAASTLNGIECLRGVRNMDT